MSPDKFTELVRAVEKHTTTGLCGGGWRLDALEDDGPPGRLNGYPFATTEEVGVHLFFKRGDLTVGADVSSSTRATWRDFRPSISWTKSFRQQRHEFSLRTATEPSFVYSFFHPQFTATCETRLMDGLSSVFTVSTHISPENHLGFSAAYDPSRSGLRDYTVALSCAKCSAVQKGDLVVKYNATRGAALHMCVPLKPEVNALALVERGRVVVGAEIQAARGTRAMMDLNLLDFNATVAVVRNISDALKVTLSCSTPLRTNAWAAPKFGVLFSSQKAP